MSERWEARAGQWLAWARSPDFDAYRVTSLDGSPTLVRAATDRDPAGRA